MCLNCNVLVVLPWLLYFLSASLNRAHASTEHFFCLRTLREVTCAFWISHSCSPIAKRTHVCSAFPHTYVLLSLDFDDIDNTWLCILNFSLLSLLHLTFRNCGTEWWLFVCSLKLSGNGLCQYLHVWPSQFGSSDGMYLSWNFFLSRDFHKF